MPYYRFLIAAGQTSAGQRTEIAVAVTTVHAEVTGAPAKLINKGIVCAPEHGQISFTVPGTANFIERQQAVTSG